MNNHSVTNDGPSDYVANAHPVRPCRQRYILFAQPTTANAKVMRKVIR